MKLGQEFWNDRYLTQNIQWNLGQVSPPLKQYFEQITNKEIKILIPGCGNAYEAEYLSQLGFTNIVLIDIAPKIVEELKDKFEHKNNIQVIHDDFFNHINTYDLIIEQTFFCALNPDLRKQYVEKMHQLINTNGKLVGLLFNKIFEADGPPFGGTIEEYILLFNKYFHLNTFENCYNSFSKRENTELFINCTKK